MEAETKTKITKFQRSKVKDKPNFVCYTQAAQKSVFNSVL